MEKHRNVIEMLETTAASLAGKRGAKGARTQINTNTNIPNIHHQIESTEDTPIGQPIRIIFDFISSGSSDRGNNWVHCSNGNSNKPLEAFRKE